MADETTATDTEIGFVERMGEEVHDNGVAMCQISADSDPMVITLQPEASILPNNTTTNTPRSRTPSDVNSSSPPSAPAAGVSLTSEECFGVPDQPPPVPIAEETEKKEQEEEEEEEEEEKEEAATEEGDSDDSAEKEDTASAGMHSTPATQTPELESSGNVRICSSAEVASQTKSDYCEKEDNIDGGTCNSPSITPEKHTFLSGNISSCSSAEITTRTRLETNDSSTIDHTPTNISSSPQDQQSHLYDVDKHNSKKLAFDAFAEDEAAKCSCQQCFKCWLKCINQKWIWSTKKLRLWMLRGVVALSMKAARHPRKCLIGISVLSFTLVITGYLTNFQLRLDNDKLFTPTNSELVELARFRANTSLYEGVDVNQRRERRRLAAASTSTMITKILPSALSVAEIKARGISMPASFTGNTSYTNTTSIETEDAAAGTEMDTVSQIEWETTEAHTLAPTAVATTNADPNQENGGFSSHLSGQGYVFPFLIHADHRNVFTMEGVHKVFDLLDFMNNIPGYKEVCGQRPYESYQNFYGVYTCEVRAITRFWNHNRTLFEEQVKTEDDLYSAADKVFYPDGGYVDLPFVLAEKEDDETGRPIAGQAFFAWIFLKESYFADTFDDHLLEFRQDWAEDHSHPYRLEFANPTSYEREFKKAILGDVPLLPIVFAIMCFFTCFVYFKCDRVRSRTLLGIGAVVTILMSVMSGFGLLFLCGVPMTIMTNLLVFVVVGVGLDDTFIITGAYFRSGHQGDPVERMEATMESVGLSILLTSVTTAAAFILGTPSTILPLRWLCLYAFPTIIIDFIYQITFFVALLVLDEQRILQNRMDCCVCIKAPKDPAVTEGESNESTAPKEEEEQTCADMTPASVFETREQGEGSRRADFEREPSLNFKDLEHENHHVDNSIDHQGHGDNSPRLSGHLADRFMRWFATVLMYPVVKILVMLAFAAFASFCAYRTTLLRQQFNFKDLLPKGSHVAEFITAIDYYSDRAMPLKIQFRFVDQSDPDIRAQMEQYVEDLVNNVDALSEPPPMFWVREFRTYVESNETIKKLPFYEQLDILLSNPTVNDAFGKHIIRRPDGTILTSVCQLYVTDLDMDVVRDQIVMYQQVRDVTARQPINQGKKLWCFFTYDILFHIFSFYEVCVGQLTITTISSVVTVCVLGLIFIPHWTAVPIIAPVISILFIEMMGILQMFGYSINVVTYVILVISIGLLVDYVMHILLRYYESEYPTREEKVKDALGTMGASILVGGLSTFLGVTPLIFSTSLIFSTICLAFLTIVALGITHGLILVPVLLSYFGTEETVTHRKRISMLRNTTASPQQIHHSRSKSSIIKLDENN